MRRSLKRCMANREIVSLYCNSEGVEKHLVGYIVSLDEDTVLIAHISPHGKYDGFVMKRIADIFRIDCGGEYEKRIETLYIEKKQSHPNLFHDDETGILLDTVLRSAKENNYIVSCEYETEIISGFVQHYDDDIFQLDIVTEAGELNGIAVIDAESVLTFSIDSEDEQDLKILHQRH